MTEYSPVLIASCDVFRLIPCERTYFIDYSKGFEPGSDSRSCSVIVLVRVVLKRTVVGDSD